MPRQRMVKPEFFDSESLALCSIEARLAFIGLWVMGDDYGNQKAQFFRLQHRIFPYDEMGHEKFMDLLCELEEVGCVKGYEVDGERYLNVPNFSAYQTVRKPSATNVPEPPKETVKAKRTKKIHQWRTSGAQVTHDGGSDAPVTHSDDTSSPERKKEGSNFSLREKIANERSASGDAALAGATPPAACPRCDGPLEKTSSHKPNGSTLYRCKLCAEEVWT